MIKITKLLTGGVKYESPACSVISLIVNDTVLVVISNPNDWMSEDDEINGKSDIFGEEL